MVNRGGGTECGKCRCRRGEIGRYEVEVRGPFLLVVVGIMRDCLDIAAPATRIAVVFRRHRRHRPTMARRRYEGSFAYDGGDQHGGLERKDEGKQSQIRHQPSAGCVRRMKGGGVV
jgi:hypothetical protein